MVAVKTHQADAFLKGFERQTATTPSAVLLYGTDAGLVAERALALAKRLAERENPPGEILRLDDASLEEELRPHRRGAADRADVRRPQDRAGHRRPAHHGGGAETAGRGRRRCKAS